MNVYLVSDSDSLFDDIFKKFKNIYRFYYYVFTTSFYIILSDVMKCVLRVESGESRLQQSPAARRGRPGTGLGVVSVSEKSNTAQISPSSSWRPKVGGGSSLLPVYKIF